jgi:hypothetical protein
MSAALRGRLEQGGTAVDPGQRYRVASTEYLVTRRDEFGEPDRVETGDVLLRDALVAHLRAGALGSA